MYTPTRSLFTPALQKNPKAINARPLYLASTVEGALRGSPGSGFLANSLLLYARQSSEWRSSSPPHVAHTGRGLAQK